MIMYDMYIIIIIIEKKQQTCLIMTRSIHVHTAHFWTHYFKPTPQIRILKGFHQWVYKYRGFSMWLLQGRWLQCAWYSSVSRTIASAMKTTCIFAVCKNCWKGERWRCWLQVRIFGHVFLSYYSLPYVLFSASIGLCHFGLTLGFGNRHQLRTWTKFRLQRNWIITISILPLTSLIYNWHLFQSIKCPAWTFACQQK